MYSHKLFSILLLTIYCLDTTYSLLSINDNNLQNSDRLQKYENIINQYRAFTVQNLLNFDNRCDLFNLIKHYSEDTEKNLLKIDESTPESTYYNLKNYLFKLNDSIEDPKLYSLIILYLDKKCNLLNNENFLKRSGKVIGKKLQFHSWGGKRNGKETSKVVIRTPFHSWGGKRSGDNNNILIDEDDLN